MYNLLKYKFSHNLGLASNICIAVSATSAFNLKLCLMEFYNCTIIFFSHVLCKFVPDVKCWMTFCAGYKTLHTQTAWNNTLRLNYKKHKEKLKYTLRHTSFYTKATLHYTLKPHQITHSAYTPLRCILRQHYITHYIHTILNYTNRLE